MKRLLIWLLCLSLVFTLPTVAGVAQNSGATAPQSQQNSVADFQTEITPQTTPLLEQGEDSVVAFLGETATQTTQGESEEPITTPFFWVESVTARAGEEISVAVGVDNNPGIVSAKLNLSYNAQVLEGVSLKTGEFPEVSFSKETANPLVINFMNAIAPNNTTNGALATVTFKVKEDAPLGDYDFTLSYDPADVFNYDLTPVAFHLQQGKVTVLDYIPGDVNNNGDVDNKDLALLLRYLNNWAVEIHHNAADVNGDGEINNMDFVLLQRYLNGWDVTLTHGNYVEPVNTIRVGTYHINALANVNGNVETIANFIAQNGLDVVSLQAVDNGTGRNNNNYHQAREIANRLGWYWGYSACIAFGNGEYGTAILSKYPIDSYQSIQLDSAGEENRLLGHAVLDVAGKKINILNSHLSYQSKLETQVNQVAEYAKSLENFIMAADFNTENFGLLARISGNMVNNYGNKMITHPEDGAVDNILASPFVMDEGVKVDNTYSVHALVYADVHLNQTVTPVTSLRAGTFNIHYLANTAGDADATAQFLAPYNLDVIGLQEVDKNVGRDGPVQDQAQVLAEKLGMYYAYSKAIDLGSGEYGTAILSQYPIVSYQTISLNSGDEEQRVMGHAVLNVAGQMVNLLNTHLSFQTMNQTQITQVKNYVASLDAYILTGDFSTSNFVNLAQIDGKMINNLVTPFQTSVDDGAVDNIFVKGYGATNGVMGQTTCSDHHLLYTAVNLYPNVQTVNGLRVGTYNIRHLADVGGDATVIANFIKANNLDLVGLQEVDNNVGRDGPKQNQVQAIAEALGWYWGFSKAIDLSGGEYGHGIISKYPMEAYATYQLQSGAEEARVMAHSVINVAGRKVNFLNVHLSWQSMTGTQVTQVANHAKGYGKYIVVGDFNAEYDELTEISGTMVNNATDRFVTNVEDGCIDNIIANGMGVGKGTMVESSYSDHSMLYADITF